MLEKTRAEYIEKPPKGHHSVKGVGKTEPDPNLIKKIDGVEVPVGKGVSTGGTTDGALLYNEYPFLMLPIFSLKPLSRASVCTMIRQCFYWLALGSQDAWNRKTRHWSIFSLIQFFRYIVYDVAQVHIKYLLKLKFKYVFS